MIGTIVFTEYILMLFLGFRAMGLVVSRETQHMGVQYYVDKSFEKEYRGAALDELEKTIESDYIEHLQNSCWKEKQQSKQAGGCLSNWHMTMYQPNKEIVLTKWKYYLHLVLGWCKIGRAHV